MLVQTYSSVCSTLNTDKIKTSWSEVTLVCSGDVYENVTYSKIIVIV